MIARGDLGVEVPIEKIAIVQKRLMHLANRSAKPVITATQMLESMIDNRRPTRAEATDVANAILDGTDCVMLSAESAMGRYPVDAVVMLARIAVSAEAQRPVKSVQELYKGIDLKGLVRPGHLIAIGVEACLEYVTPAAVFVPTKSGATARGIARFRLPAWTVAVSAHEATCRHLQFSSGVYPVCESPLPGDWTDYVRKQVASFGFEGNLAMLTEGPSPDHPEMNHRLEIIEIPSRMGYVGEGTGNGGASNRTIRRERFDAVLFDLDGVLTDTASVHAACWKKMFDAFLQKHAEEKNIPFQPFDVGEDYRRYVDGKLRYDGVKSFLDARGIGLHFGDVDEPPGFESIAALGNLKDRMVQDVLETEGVRVYGDSVVFLRRLREAGFKTAVVSASRNAGPVLQVAGIADLFDARIDGVVADSRHLAGKPAPDTFLEAARQLGCEPMRAVVVEDAVSGVRAGREGRFGLVVAVARAGNRDILKEGGADVVVDDLSELK
jgi:beta-phosphoglucomutase family hydrolase